MKSIADFRCRHEGDPVKIEDVKAAFETIRTKGLESPTGFKQMNDMADAVSKYVSRMEKYEDLEAYFKALVETALLEPAYKELLGDLNRKLAVRIGFQLATLRISATRAGIPDEQSQAAIAAVNAIINDERRLRK